jgi:signal transduction histidine kinase
MHPQHLRDPLAGATISWLFFLALLGVLGGHFADSLRRREFFQRREAQRLARELQVLKDSLEEQVFERTAEVRELAQHVESAREAERTRIARDLHDDLGQELTALRYGVEFARSRWTKSPASIGMNLDDVHGLATSASQSLRAILSDLRPRVLDDLGFNAAAEWLVKRTGARTGLQVALVQRGEDRPLPNDLATSAFRVLQEALSNATRHADAVRVDVEIDLQDDALVLTVQDDGRGFDPGKKDNRGYGLIGMRERAAFHGGAARVESAAGAGTCVRLRLPLPAAAEVQW